MFTFNEINEKNKYQKVIYCTCARSRDPVCHKTTIISHLIGGRPFRSMPLSSKFLSKRKLFSCLKGYCGNMTMDKTILCSLTFTRTIPVSNDIDVGDYQTRVMEEIRTYEIRFLQIGKKIEYYIIDRIHIKHAMKFYTFIHKRKENKIIGMLFDHTVINHKLRQFSSYHDANIA